MTALLPNLLPHSVQGIFAWLGAIVFLYLIVKAFKDVQESKERWKTRVGSLFQAAHSAHVKMTSLTPQATASDLRGGRTAWLLGMAKLEDYMFVGSLNNYPELKTEVNDWLIKWHSLLTDLEYFAETLATYPDSQLQAHQIDSLINTSHQLEISLKSLGWRVLF